MVKKISCRVVSSVPLGKSGEALRHVWGSNNKRHRVGDIVAVNIPVRHAGGLVTYTSRFGIARALIDNGPMGQILDCYV